MNIVGYYMKYDYHEMCMCTYTRIIKTLSLINLTVARTMLLKTNLKHISCIGLGLFTSRCVQI